MRSSQHTDLRQRLLPEGRRWGFGAHSVLPYLVVTQATRPGDPPAEAASIRNPVFPKMDLALRLPRHGH